MAENGVEGALCGKNDATVLFCGWRSAVTQEERSRGRKLIK